MKRPRQTLVIAAILVPLGLIAWALLVPEELDFERAERAAGFELRRYPPYMVAETTVTTDFDGVRAAAYPRLVGYVQGQNQAGRKVPMRAPASQQPADPAAENPAQNPAQNPAETPADGAAGTWLVQFVMAPEYLPSMLPRPAAPEVTLRLLPARLIAARRYGGGWGEARSRKQAAALLAAVEAAGLTPVGAPVFARYNAPFVPGFLRRNEVQVEVRDPDPS